MRLDYNVLLDKTYGTFVGKTIAGVLGAPFEAHKAWGDYNDPDMLWPDKLYPNDDLDIQLVFLDMMLEEGPKVTYEKIAKYWRERCWYNFCEYGSFLNNEQRGIHAPLSGKFNNSYWFEDQGCPIRAEVWGVTSPCNIDLAAEHARIDGSSDHIGESVNAEMFWAACTSYAYMTEDFDEIVENALSVINPQSDIYKIALEVKELTETGKSLKSMWREIVRRWGCEDFSDARINFAFALLTLYYSKLDIKKAVLCTINLGWDVDCTCGIASALIGTIKGNKALPVDWKERIGDNLTCDVNTSFKDKTILEFSQACCEVAIESSLTINKDLEIINIPSDVMDRVKKRMASRKEESPISFETLYGEDFVLTEEGAKITVKVINNSEIAQTGEIKAESSCNLSFDKCSVKIPPMSEIDININVFPKGNVLWNKNLINITFETDKGEVYTYQTGTPGAHLWKVYGPYWDYYNKEEFDICPFRNHKENYNPCAGPGDCPRSMFHNWTFLDREYLDEKRLFKEDIFEEEPYEIEVAEDIIRGEDLDLKLNESLVYLTGNIVFDKETECNIFIGANSPFVLYIDGEKVQESNKYGTYAPHDNVTTNMKFDTTPKRFVIKVLKPNNDFKLGMQFILTDWTMDKEHGVSYILDNYGFVID